MSKDILPPVAGKSITPIEQALMSHLQGGTDHYNIVAPFIHMTELPPMRRLVVYEVNISQDDLYWTERGVALGKVALSKIMAAAGLSITSCRRTDDRRHPHIYECTVEGELEDPTGRVRRFVEVKAIDLTGSPGMSLDSMGADAAEKIRARTSGDEKNNRKPDPTHQRYWPEIVKARQNIASLASTKAQLRLARMALSIPISMTKEQALRPWLIPALVPDYSSDDPIVRQMVVAKQLGLHGMLYPEAQEQRRSIEPGLDAAIEIEAEQELEIPSIPIPQETIDAAREAARRKYLTAINARLDALEVESSGDLGDEALAIAAGIDWATSDLERIAELGTALSRMIEDRKE